MNTCKIMIALRDATNKPTMTSNRLKPVQETPGMHIRTDGRAALLFIGLADLRDGHMVMG